MDPMIRKLDTPAVAPATVTPVTAREVNKTNVAITPGMLTTARQNLRKVAPSTTTITELKHNVTSNVKNVTSQKVNSEANSNFSSKSVTQESPPPIIPAARSITAGINRATANKLDAVASTEAKDKSVLARDQMLKECNKLVDVITNKLEIICGKDWDGNVDKFEDAEKKLIFGLNDDLNEAIKLSDKMKSKDYKDEDLQADYNKLKSITEKNSGDDRQIAMKGGKPASILEHGIEVSPGVYRGGSKEYLQKMSKTLDDMKAAFPFLKGTAGSNTETETESGKINTSSSQVKQINKGTAQELSSLKSTSNDDIAAQTTKNEQKYSFKRVIDLLEHSAIEKRKAIREETLEKKGLEAEIEKKTLNQETLQNQ